MQGSQIKLIDKHKQVLFVNIRSLHSENIFYAIILILCYYSVMLNLPRKQRINIILFVDRICFHLRPLRALDFL